jgi:hypothetical protein
MGFGRPEKSATGFWCRHSQVRILPPQPTIPASLICEIVGIARVAIHRQPHLLNFRSLWTTTIA